MRTLLTGFGPFGEVVSNPSARIVAHFEQAGAPGHELTTRVLPVSYARAGAEIAALLREGSFVAALLLGVAHREPVIRIEQLGRWRASERPDCDGHLPDPAGPPPGALEQYPATVDLELLLADLASAGVPARLSEDAGQYLCNHSYYAALHSIAAHNLPTRCLFVHVPADPETLSEPTNGPTIPLARQIEAVGLILARLARGQSINNGSPQRHRNTEIGT